MIRKILVMVVLLLAMGQDAWAQNSGWTVTWENDWYNSSFRISRSQTGSEKKVYYRTVGLSAMEGENYTGAWSVLTFKSSDSSILIPVDENSDPRDPLFRYHNGVGRSYRFEVLDESFQTVLASCVRNIDGKHNYYGIEGQYFNRGIQNLVRLKNGAFSSDLGANRYYDVKDEGSANEYVFIYDYYDYNNTSKVIIPTEGFFQALCPGIATASGLPYLLDATGVRLYATVCFTEKEVQDGYQYIQILADEVTNKDGKDPDGNVDTPDKSIYKACFEGYKEGNKVPDIEYKWFFPHRTDDNYNATEFSHAKNYLYKQAFRDDSFRAAQSGSLVLSPQVQNIVLRFDANGQGGDTWKFRKLFVRLALSDEVAPTVLNRSVASTAYPYNNSPATISIPFSEIVVVQGTPTITTSWGTFTYEAGSGSNVLAFSGTINATAGTQLSVTGLSGTVKDLAGNAFTWTGTRTGRTVLARDSADELQKDSYGRYVISTKEQLKQIAEIVNKGTTFHGKTLIVTADINNNGNPIEPIGTAAHPFSGTFQGKGHVISGITHSGGDNYCGLFGYIDGGSVRDVILRDCSFTGRDYVGGIAGYIIGGIVTNCIVESSVTLKAGKDNAQCYGGVAGYLANGTVEGCRCAASLNLNNHTGCTYLGGIVGRMEVVINPGASLSSAFSKSTLQGCLYEGHTLPPGAGAIVGEKSTVNNNYYTDANLANLPGGTSSGDKAGACLARTITLGDNEVGIGRLKSNYSVSGISTYNNVLSYNGNYYSGEGLVVQLCCDNLPVGYQAVYSVNNETIDGNSFTMPAGNVTVKVAKEPASSLSFSGQNSDGSYWITFCHGSFDYTLPEDAWAYTMGPDYQLYRLGDDGKTIPHGTPVVIVSINRIITLTRSDAVDAASVALHGGENILQGGNEDVVLQNGKVNDKIPYVFGVAGGKLGFFPFTGPKIPANKAYYLRGN